MMVKVMVMVVVFVVMLIIAMVLIVVLTMVTNVRALLGFRVCFWCMLVRYPCAFLFLF